MHKTKRSTTLKAQLFVITLLFATPALKAQQANFSGTWTRNTDKCDAGGLSINSVPVEISVKQDTGQIEIRRISKNYKGDTTEYTEKVKFGGTQVSSVIRSNLNKKASIQWLSDKKAFTERAAYADDKGNPKQTVQEIWDLDGAGNTLKIQMTLTSGGQDFQLIEVYDKK